MTENTYLLQKKAIKIKQWNKKDSKNRKQSYMLEKFNDINNIKCQLVRQPY